MTLLVIGVLLWWVTHLFPLMARPTRNRMAAAMGENAYKGVYSLVTLAIVLLIGFAFAWAPFEPVYLPPAWGVHANNLLMLFAVAGLGAAHSKSRIRKVVRHPMLWGVVLWAVAHLLANGDLAGLILFGGLGLWAIAAMFATNARDGAWTPPEGLSAAGDIRLAVISVVVFAVIGAIHFYLFGVWPFGG